MIQRTTVSTYELGWAAVITYHPLPSIECKDKNPRKTGIWETANDHIESTTGRRLDGK